MEKKKNNNLTKCMIILFIILLVLIIGLYTYFTFFHSNIEKKVNEKKCKKISYCVKNINNTYECFQSNYSNEESIECLENDLNIDNYKINLSNKYNLNINKLKLQSLKKTYEDKVCEGIFCENGYYVTVPNFLKYKYDDKIITVYGNKDDFYYDDLVNGVDKYFSKTLGIEKLYAIANPALSSGGYSSSEYASFLMANQNSMNENEINNFISNTSFDILVELNINDLENKISILTQKVNDLNLNIDTIQVMSNLSMIKTYREQPNYEYFDYYYIKGINYSYRYSLISKNSNDIYTYSSIDYNAKI